VGPSITVVPPEQRPLAQMLADGEIDALVHEKAHGILKVNPQLRRLLPDHRADEIANFRATGCFPINHCLAIRSEIVSAHPWIVGSLVGAFEESKRIALAAMSGNNTVVSTPWMDDILEAQGRVLGDDPYAYGLEANRPQLERLVRYLYEQRLIPQPQAIEDLFADAAGGRPPGLRTSP
jgi:4,5-dihydroxyphthalate decarboxylase